MTGANVVKFPIGRVVREHRIGCILAASPEAEELDRALRSVQHALTTLRRQEASLILRYRHAREQETPEQHARLVDRNTRRVFACAKEDREADTDDNPAA